MALAAPIKLTLPSLTTRHYCYTLAIHGLLILGFFFLPLSLTLKSICVLVAALPLLFHYRVQFIEILKAHWAWANLLLFLLICGDCFRGSAPFELQGALLHKYSKLMYLPVFALALQESRMRHWAIQAFLAANLITFCGSLLKIVGLLHWGSSDPSALFYNHIVTGYFMAFAAFLAAYYVMHSQGYRRLYYSMLALIFSMDILFINTGRTGYAVYLLLTILFVFHYIRQAKYLLLLLPLVGFLGWHSSTVTTGIAHLIQDTKNYNHDVKETSLGFRLQFHDYARSLWLKQPLNGLGTGEFMNQFIKDQPIPTWGPSLNQPHSEYWLMASEHGLLGVGLFLSLFFCLLYVSYQITEMRLPLQGLVLSFLLGCTSDAWLFISPTGFFMVMFAALGAGEWLSLTANSTCYTNDLK